MLCYQCKTERPDNAEPCPSCGAVPDPFLGRVLQDKFEIRKRLGQGGFGAVYEAYHRELESKVAVKTLHAGLSGSSQAIERFRREGLATSKLQSPNVVKVFDRGNTADGILWLAMEFVQGENLGERLARQQRLTEPEVIEIFGPICEALQEAHAKGIIHRDLKPDNIMLTTLENGKPFPKLLDFGIASLRTSDGSLTQSGTISGTPKYMAPEQWEGLKRTDARTDLYALGIIAYQCLSGELPFMADSPFGWMSLHYNTPPRPLREQMGNRPLSEHAEAAVMRAIAKPPEERFATSLEFFRALSGEAPTPSAQRHPAPLSKAGAGFGEAHTLEDISAKSRGRSLQGAAAISAPSGSLEAPKKRGRVIWGVSSLLGLGLLGAVAYYQTPTASKPPTEQPAPTRPETQVVPSPPSAPSSVKSAAEYAAQEKWATAADLEQDPARAAEYKKNAEAKSRLEVCKAGAAGAPEACQEVIAGATYERYKQEAAAVMASMKSKEQETMDKQLQEILELMGRAEREENTQARREPLVKARRSLEPLLKDAEFSQTHKLSDLKKKLDAAIKSLPPTPAELEKQIRVYQAQNNAKQACLKFKEYKQAEKSKEKVEALSKELNNGSIDLRDKECEGVRRD